MKIIDERESPKKNKKNKQRQKRKEQGGQKLIVKG